jgi:hypothetical protein
MCPRSERETETATSELPRQLQNKHEVTEQSRRYPMTPGHPIVTLVFAFPGAQSGQIWGLEAESRGRSIFTCQTIAYSDDTRDLRQKDCETASPRAWLTFLLLLILFLLLLQNPLIALLYSSSHPSNHVKIILYQRCGIAQQTFRPVYHC